MKPLTQQQITRAVGAFAFEGAYVGALPYGSGHINDTLAVYVQLESGAARRYILQRINTDVFRNPIALMENILHVTGHVRDAVIQAGGDPLREGLTLVLARDGRQYWLDEDGGYWRAYVFIEGAATLQRAEKPEDFYQSARAFGRFQQLLAAFPAKSLHETIPNFHNTPDRLDQLKAAVERDALGRLKDVRSEVDFALSHQREVHALQDQLEAGVLPLRVTHNDTKLNNVMIDDATGQGICVIDLDTVMPGLTAYDFGDAIRFGASTAAEDETDLSLVQMDLTLFEAYVRGFMETAGQALTAQEIASLPVGAKMMTLECGIRFLTDYLSGDTYFRIHREHHNLDRARTQFTLVRDMQNKDADMRAIVDRYRV